MRLQAHSTFLSLFDIYSGRMNSAFYICEARALPTEQFVLVSPTFKLWIIKQVSLVAELLLYAQEAMYKYSTFQICSHLH